jgi:anti-anti-sigma factor
MEFITVVWRKTMSLVKNEKLTENIHLVELSGPLNVTQEDKVVQLFRDVAAQGVERVIIDLEDVPFIDSRGLVALIAGYRLFGSNPANFRLSALGNQPRLVFELTGFDLIFETFDSVADALADMTPKAELLLGIPVPVPQMTSVYS